MVTNESVRTTDNVDANYENILFEKRDGIAKITLNRPERMNALSQGLLADLRRVTDEIEADHEIRVVLLTGAGRAFTSGFDINPSEVRAVPSDTERWETMNLAPRTLLRFWYLRQPTIAAVNGHAVAAGNVLALSCDIVLASDAAHFSEPEIRHVAHSPFTFLPFMTFNKSLNWFYLTGDSINAETAKEMGLVNAVIPADQLEAETWRVATRLAAVPPFAAQQMKRSIHQVYDKMGFTAALEHHLTIRQLGSLTPDIPEKEKLTGIRQTQGLRAFLAERDGQFNE